MRKPVLFASAAAIAAATLSIATTAAAQEASGSARAGMALPGAAPAAAASGDSDHSMMIGTLAVGYLGRRGMTVGYAAVAQDAPIVGVRYWLDEMLGIDAGLGFNFGNQKNEPQGGPNTEIPGPTVFMLHGGVPLSLLAERHYSFQIVPEMNVGFASQTIDLNPGEQANSGFHLDVGARAGAEVHFGFIDIPRLSLQADVGVRIAMDSGETEISGGGQTVTNSRSSWSFATTVGDNPWNIFTSNISALYYF